MTPTPVDAAPTRVLVVSSWEETCGIATYSSNLVAELRRAGADVDVFALDRAGQVYMTRRERRVHLLRCIEQARSADIVHVQHEFGLFGLTPVESLRLTSRLLSQLRALRKPSIVTFHSLPPSPSGTMAPPKPRSRRERTRMLLARTAWRWFVVRHFIGRGILRALVHTPLARRLLNESGVPLGRIDVIAHGVAPRQPAIGRDEARRRLGYEDNVVLLSLFGFVSSYKGVDTALEALDRLPDNYRVAVVGGRHPASKGDPSFDDALSALRFRQRVRVTGWVDLPTLDLYHAATDICIAPYRETGLLASGAITWALSSGKPTVATRIAAFVELAHMSRCVYLVAQDSPDELAFAAQAIAGSPELSRMLTDASRLYCADNSWARVAQRHLELYRRYARRNARGAVAGARGGAVL